MTAETPAIARDTRARRDESALWTEIDGEVVVMSVEAGRYFTLDEIGADIWNRLETTVRVDELVEALGRDYDGDALVIEADVLALLGRMAEHGLLVVER